MQRSCWLPILVCGLVTACGAGMLSQPTATTAPSPVPSSTPEPQPVLDPNALWIAADSPSTSVLVVEPITGSVTRVPLPLNEGQEASDIVASPEGRFLAYLVWDDDGTVQHGIASWNLREPNARLITQPLPGYRIISLMLTLSGEVVFVQVQNGPLLDAGWRLEIAPASGGPSELLANRTTAPELLLPQPINLRAGTLMMAAESTGNEHTVSLYALESASGDLQEISLPEDHVMGSGALSPDGTQIAYVVDHVVRVANVRTQEATTITPPDGSQAISVAWFASSDELLLDLLTMPDAPETQTWARVKVSSSPPWPTTDPDPLRAQLFTYRPFDGGVTYTLFPTNPNDTWILYLLPQIAEGVAPIRIPLDNLPGGSPKIIYAPDR